jgi:hypothetical protein
MAQPISSSTSNNTLHGSWILSKPAGVKSALQHRAGRRGPGNNRPAVAGAAISLPAHFAAVATATSVAYTATSSLALMAQPISNSTSNSTLPGSWDLTKPAGVKSAMQLLMPGLLADKDNTRNANNIDKALGC